MYKVIIFAMPSQGRHSLGIQQKPHQAIHSAAWHMLTSIVLWPVSVGHGTMTSLTSLHLEMTLSYFVIHQSVAYCNNRSCRYLVGRKAHSKNQSRSDQVSVSPRSRSHNGTTSISAQNGVSEQVSTTSSACETLTSCCAPDCITQSKTSIYQHTPIFTAKQYTMASYMKK